MPSMDKISTVMRQWALVRCLSVRFQTTQQLHRRLCESWDIAVDENTVLRDLKLLSGAGLAIERTDTKPINWRLQKAWAEKLGAMPESEALMIVLADQYLRQALPVTLGRSLGEVAALARNTLSAGDQARQSGSKHVQWLQKVRVTPGHQPLLPPEIAPDIHEALVRALLEDQPVRARYKGCAIAKLSPLGLIVRGGVSYLAATRDALPEVRHFALHRFESVAPLYGEGLNRPDDFDLDALLASGWADFQSEGERHVDLVLWCRRELKDLLWETRLGEDQWITPQPVAEGWYRVTVGLPWTWQLRMWLLSQGRKVRVMEPGWLREEIRGELAAALESYQS